MLLRRIILALVALLIAANAAAQKVVFFTVDYPPYYGSNLENDGPVTEIVAEAYRRVGYEIEVNYMPWARAYQEAKAGNADGLLGAWYSEEREKSFIFSDPLPGNEVVLFKQKDAKPEKFTSYAELQPYRIGIVRGYRNPPEFDAANLKTEKANSDKINLTKLAKGRVDLILVDRALANHIIRKELPEYEGDLVAVEPPVEVLPLYILFSRAAENAQEKADAFNRGLKLLQKEGRVEEILKQHGIASTSL